MRHVCALFMAAVLCAAGFGPLWAGDPESTLRPEFTVYPIGEVKKEGGRTRIVIRPEFQPGLLGLGKSAYIHVLYWFDRNDTPQERSILQVHPRGNRNNPLAGVFATRAPVRPNLIALSLCKILSIRANVIEIDRIDAFDDTPVLDIKPHVPGIDTIDGK